MTDPTVDPEYYSDPCLQMCEHCGAAWRFGLNPWTDPNEMADDMDYLNESVELHLCEPHVTPSDVEAVRAAAARITDGWDRILPANIPVETLLEQYGQPEVVAMMEREQLRDTAALDLLLAEVGRDPGLITTAAPLVIGAEKHMWEWLLWLARITVLKGAHN